MTVSVPVVHFRFISQLTEENDHEIRQTSTEKGTKMTKSMLEAPQPAQSFVLYSYTMHELRYQNRFLLVCSSVRGEQPLCS